MSASSEYHTLAISLHPYTLYLVIGALIVALAIALAFTYDVHTSNNLLRQCVIIQSRTIETQTKNIELLEAVNAMRGDMVEEMRGQIAEWNDLVEAREHDDEEGPPPYEMPAAGVVRQDGEE